MKEYAAYILTKLAVAKSAGQLPRRVNLATYSSDEDLRRFRPDEKWEGGAAEHASVMLEMVSTIASLFPEVETAIVEIDTNEYDKWLLDNDIADCPSARATFVSLED